MQLGAENNLNSQNSMIFIKDSLAYAQTRARLSENDI